MEDNMDNTPKTESMKRLIESIDKGDIVLPEFQRDFVWEIGKTYDLFDSLVRDIFTGSIIYGIPSFEITVRELDRRPRKVKGNRKKLTLSHYDKETVETKARVDNFRLVLDGQQRITSMFRAIKGIDDIWFIAKHNDELPDDKELHQFTVEDFLHCFSGQEDSERLSIKVSDAYEIMEKNYFEADIRLNYFDVLTYVRDMAEDERLRQFRRYLTIMKKLQLLFNADKLLSYYLLNTTSEKFSLFFERSNSKGIQLNFIDILAAKLYAGFNLRDKIDEFIDQNPGYELNREIIVRMVSYLVSDGRQIDRAYILSNLNHQYFNQWWEVVCDLYKRSIDFLFTNHFILSQSWMPYQNMLIPLMVFLKSIGGDFSQMNEGQHAFTQYWYWASIFSERYSGSSNEIIIQDSKVLQRVGQGLKVTDKTFFFKLKNQVSSPDELLSFNRKNSAIYSGMLNLVNYKVQGLIDWKNSSKLSLNSRLEDHHIFPKEYVKGNYKNENEAVELIDSVVNRTLIPKITNIKIGKKPPSVYLKELKSYNPRIADSLKRHLIPASLLSGELDQSYREFLTVRAKSMFELIADVVNDQSESIFEHFYQEPNLSESKREVIKVFAVYKDEKFNGELDLSSNDIIYNGVRYSVSGAGSAVKKEVTGKDYSTNGWQFWKYLDDQNQERFIETLRLDSNV